MARFEHPLIAIQDIPEDGGAVVEFFGRQAHVARDDAGRPVAFMDMCLHLGGPLAREGAEFVCGWHGARFDASSGRRLSAPAPEGQRLLRLPTIVKDGVLTYVWGSDDAA